MIRIEIDVVKSQHYRRCCFGAAGFDEGREVVGSAADARPMRAITVQMP